LPDFSPPAHYQLCQQLGAKLSCWNKQRFESGADLKASPARKTTGRDSASSGELRSLAWCVCLLPLLVGCPQLQDDEFEKIQLDGASGSGGSAGQTNSTNTTSSGSGASGGSGGSGGDGSGGTATTTASAGGSSESTATQSTTDSASSTGGGGNGGTGSTNECGNNLAEAGEDCDGADLDGASCDSMGMGPGELSCNEDCSFETSLCDCGDNEVQEGEACDGTALAGGTCDELGFVGGTLTCSDQCEFDTAECTSEAVCDSEATGQTGEVFSEDLSKYESRVETHNCADGAEGPDVSFLWTAPTTDCYQISVASTSDLDALVLVYADCSLEEELGCDDDSGYGYVPSLYFADATAGTTYAVVVDSYDSSESAPVTVEITLCGGDWGGSGSNTGGRP